MDLKIFSSFCCFKNEQYMSTWPFWLWYHFEYRSWRHVTQSTTDGRSIFSWRCMKRDWLTSRRYYVRLYILCEYLCLVHVYPWRMCVYFLKLSALLVRECNFNIYKRHSFRQKTGLNQCSLFQWTSVVFMYLSALLSSEKMESQHSNWK